jgi:ankyrin repeat protein
MREYIKLYNKVTGEVDHPDEDLDVNFDDVDMSDFNFDLDIPQDYSNSAYFSTNAKTKQKEIQEYLLTVPEAEKNFHSIKEKFNNGDNITPEILEKLAKEYKLDIETAIDATGQSLLHVAVDSMNFSAVKSLEEMNVAQKLINKQDNFGMTPMHIGAINLEIEVFKLLISLEPDSSIKDSENKTYIDYIKENEDIDKEILQSLS